MNRLAAHVRSNAVAYLALFVALGGTSYAAANLPANSVGNRQIRNGSVTPVKMDRALTAGAIRVWAEVSANGAVIAGEGHPKVQVQRGAIGHYTITWKTSSLRRCVAAGGVPMAGNNLSSGFVAAATGFSVAPKIADVAVYNTQGQPAALTFWVAVLC
jgi:hypothetical protein